MRDNAVKYFLSGYSCSEAVVKAAIDKGYVPKELLSVATAFSGGMGVKCLCGAVSGSVLVIGSIFGKNEERDGGRKKESRHHSIHRRDTHHNRRGCG